MSATAVKASLVATVAEQTPTSTAHGGRRFRQYAGEIETAKHDRQFTVRVTAGPDPIEAILAGPPTRFITTFETAIFYAGDKDQDALDQRIAEDAITMQTAFLQGGNHSTDMVGFLPEGGPYTRTTTTKRDGTAILRIAQQLHHK